MLKMENMILKEGKVLPGGILKVGSFLNQQINTVLMKSAGEEIERLFCATEVNKVLTIEASGIALAVAAGMQLSVPVVFAKKHKTSNVDGNVYSTKVHSHTHGVDYDVVVSKDYIGKDDKVLIVDDFLAHGKAMQGLIDIAGQAGADVAGIVVAVEKCFQGGGDALRDKGLRVEALAAIESMEPNKIVFR